MKKQIIIEIICFLFILLFVYAGLMKGIDMEKFKSQLDRSPVLMAFSDWIIWIIPILEFVIAILLMFLRSRLAGLYAAFTLMAIFTIYIIVILNFSEHIPCSCGGILEKMGWKTHLIFNMVFIVLGAIGVHLSSDKSESQRIAVIRKYS